MSTEGADPTFEGEGKAGENEPKPQDIQKSEIKTLNTLNKLFNIPLASDAWSGMVSSSTYVSSSLSVVQDGIAKLSNKPPIKNIKENPKVCQAVGCVLGKLDSLACDGINCICEKVPAITKPTAELCQDTQDAVFGYFLWAFEFLASFALSQMALNSVDKSLAFTEKMLEKATSMKGVNGVVDKALIRVKDARRAVRCVRRAGAARRSRHSLASAGLVGGLMSMLPINFFLYYFGIQLVAMKTTVKSTKRRRTSSTSSTSSSTHIPLEQLQEPLDGYKSDEDPDYKPDLEQDSSCSDSSSDEEDVKVNDEPGQVEDGHVDQAKDVDNDSSSDGEEKVSDLAGDVDTDQAEDVVQAEGNDPDYIPPEEVHDDKEDQGSDHNSSSSSSSSSDDGFLQEDQEG